MHAYNQPAWHEPYEALHPKRAASEEEADQFLSFSIIVTQSLPKSVLCHIGSVPRGVLTRGNDESHRRLLPVTAIADATTDGRRTSCNRNR